MVDVEPSPTDSGSKKMSPKMVIIKPQTILPTNEVAAI